MVCWVARYSTMAWVMAAMWSSLKAGGEGAAAMAGGAEGDALGGDGGVGMEGVVGGDEAGDVDEVCGEGRLAGLVWVWIAGCSCVWMSSW